VFDDRQLGLPPSAGIRHLRAFSASRTAGNVAPVSALALIILAAPDESFARDGINPHRIIDNRRVGWLLGMMADHRDGLGRCNVVTRSPAGFVGNGSIEVPSATSFSARVLCRPHLGRLVARRNGWPLLGSGPWCGLIRVFASLFSGTLLSQCLFDPASLARFQVEGVALHILNNVFRHNLALETSERVFQRFAFLQSNFCHSCHLEPALYRRRFLMLDKASLTDFAMPGFGYTVLLH
jgi:hypothetical protein